jgi:hypothetical protein
VTGSSPGRRVALAAAAAFAAAAGAAVYWLGVRPWHLRWGATDDELGQAWPGDDLVHAPRSRAVRALTVDVRPEDVWPWVMQVGRERGGFYSYTWLENLIGADIHNVDHLMPGLTDRAPGDTVWMGPADKFDGMARMVVARVIPNRAMVLVSPPDVARAVRDGVAETVWSFILRPGLNDTTRFVMLSASSRSRMLDLLFWEPAHFVMERKMMLTIKGLAERSRSR